MDESHNLHPLARSFDAVADQYDWGRPELPDELLDRLVEHIAMGPLVRMVELGAGTGKLTRLLARLNTSLIVTEPLPLMRELLHRNLPSLDIRSGTAEHIPVEDASVDVIIAADAFHWFDIDATRAEFLRVLSPTGVVVAITSTRGLKTLFQIDVAKMIQAVCVPDASLDISPSGSWQQIVHEPAFEPVTRQQFSFVEMYSSDRWLHFVESLHFVADLPQTQRAELLERIDRLAAGHLIHEAQVEFPMHFDIHLTIAKRSAAGSASA